MTAVNALEQYSRSKAKVYARANLRGIWGALPYPFTPDDELDEQGLRSNLRYCLSLALPFTKTGDDTDQRLQRACA